MIWFLICLSAFLICWRCAVICNRRNTDAFVLFLLLAICLFVVLLFMCIFIVSEHVCVERHLVGLRAEREALVYQVENNIYFGDSVGQFNSRVMINRHYHDSPWTNWFSGGYWYEIDPIELKEHA